MKISGRELAKKIYEEIKAETAALKVQYIFPKLIIVKSAKSEAVSSYVRQKVKKGAMIGIEVEVFEPSSAILKNRILFRKTIVGFNSSKKIHGIIFQKPSDPRIDEECESWIDLSKDVDGFLLNSSYEPPTYRGVKRVLKEIYKKNIEWILRKKHIVIIGKGKTGGMPILQGLYKDKVPETKIKIIDSKTPEVHRKFWIKHADLVISAVGKLNPVDYRYFSKRTILIDIGVHFNDKGKIQPDFDEGDIHTKVSYYTTTPGGIGALTVAYLMDNVIRSTLIQHK